MKTALAALIVGYGLDLLLGDPSFLYHPIRVIGNLIALLEKWLRKVFPKTPKGELAGGVFLVILVCLAGYGVPALLLFAAFKIHPVIGFLLEVLWCWQIPATKCLKDESMKVYQKLKENDLPGARYAVSMIVGRDTENLSETGVTKAAVETIAENTSDGVIAPLLFLAIGGPALGFLYKSINTMDYMVGYKNDKYLYFGRCAAKLDDVVNYIPARISAWLMILASACERMNWKNAEKIYKRADSRKEHQSEERGQIHQMICSFDIFRLDRADVIADRWFLYDFAEIHGISGKLYFQRPCHNCFCLRRIWAGVAVTVAFVNFFCILDGVRQSWMMSSITYRRESAHG